MRLRTQLALFFTALSTIVLILGGLSVWGGTKVVAIFSDAIVDIQNLSQFRSLQTLLARQKTSLNTYLLFGEIEERERIGTLSGLIKNNLNDLKENVTNTPEIESLGFQYLVIPDEVAEIFLVYNKDKDQAIKLATNSLIPKIQTFIDFVNQFESEITQKVRKEQDNIKTIVEQGGQVVFILIFWGILMGFFFAFSTFRSMNRSLKSLQEGTSAFGSGNLDYRINIPSHDELGQLAQKFNDMANNIKQLEIQTVHMHRMSAVGQLAGGVAHEINNPLTGVLGQAQLLLGKLPEDAKHRHHVEKIERAAVRCRKIVRSLLDFSRQKRAEFSHVNINESLEGALELCEPDLQNGRINIIREFSDELPDILGNSPQLQQVFLNIINNSIHAMPEGGPLTIKTQTVFLQLPHHNNEEKQDLIEISFQDKGIGISSHHLQHMFEPFFTTKEIGKGTGLGLSVSLGIIRNHGGEIIAESKGQNEGAIFKVLLPTHLDPSKTNTQNIDSSWGIIEQKNDDFQPRF